MFPYLDAKTEVSYLNDSIASTIAPDNLSLYDPGWLDTKKIQLCLDDVTCKFFMRVIESTREELSVLTCINLPEAGRVNVTNLGYKRLQERFGTDVSAKLADYRIGRIYTNVQKMQKILALIDYILREVIVEMKEFKTFNTMVGCIKDIKHNMEREDNILVKLQRRIDTYKALRNDLAVNKRKNVELSNEYTDVILKTILEIEDTREYYKSVKHYQKYWQHAREEQNGICLDNKENMHNNVITQCKNNIEKENRIFDEIRLFTEELKDDYLEEIQQWMTRYDNEHEARDNDILKIKTKTEKLKEDYEALETEYNRRVQQIDKYLEHKRKKKEEEDRRNLEIWAAIKIQAWWRGTMVRKKLGPYRPKKKGKKGQKDKGKKGKKKK